MSFAENLKQVRKEKNLSQEELAEILDVSRQAVSKWEQGIGYPEVEKLLLMANRLNISLDSLMAAEIAKENDLNNKNISGKIIITSPNENVIATCYKVSSSGKMSGGKNAPQYALYGSNNEVASFWGESSTFLGWYADNEEISKEIRAIQEAIAKGVPTYELKYSAKVERRWMSVKIVND